MRLTQRQENFIVKFIELFRELDCPIHYSKVAERLGVSDITAYDMLRLLEEKGFVASQYELAEDKSGPGRSRIVFLPTPRARRHMKMVNIAENVMGERWEGVKARALDRFRKTEMEGYILVQDILAQIPSDVDTSLKDCVEIMTILALHLRRRAGRKLLLDFLPKILASTEDASRANLNLLGGFSLGILVDETAEGREWSHELLQHVQRYQSHVSDMDSKTRRELATHILKVFETLSE
jgi:DNA-binding PadR family transcriptional regulator